MEQAIAAKVVTELTCWKCGEESLKPTTAAGAALNARGEVDVSTATQHSVCEKCGSYAVNPAQARHNKIVGRKVRKSMIREANRAST